jgi:hypothetical protein
MVARHTKSGENIPKSPQNIQNHYRICQMLIKYTKWPYYIPNGHTIYQNATIQDHQKYIKIGIFGFKKYHLATLLS